VILSLGACRLYDEPTRIRNVYGPTLRWERLALGRASRARMQAMHARARVKLLVSRRVRMRGVALASVALRLGEPLGLRGDRANQVRSSHARYLNSYASQHQLHMIS
jgi:hypothetical protein